MKRIRTSCSDNANVTIASYGPDKSKSNSENVKSSENEKEDYFEICHEHEPGELEVEKNVVEGRRMFDVKYLVQQLQNFGDHEKYGCSSKNMVFIKEIRKGFSTSLLFQCSMCNQNEAIESDTKNDEVMSVNDAMVFGNICTGQSFSQMEERCALLNIPVMSSSTYFSVQKVIHDKIRDVAVQEMEDAVKIEKELARDRGSVDKHGIPLLTVVVDGSWAKRSYKCNYSSLSGVACIVGFHSQKILFLSVRNTFCLLCTKYENMKKEIPEHICYKNWSGNANTMEADIIAEGFKQSLPMHGVKYAYMIVKNEMMLDLHNLLNHVFGSHESCASRQFQCTRGEKDTNYVEDLKLCGLWDGLKNAVRLVIQHVDSLLHNVNNNLAERCNSIVAKFIGGKRCNFVMRDSYEARCKAAAASFNNRSTFHSKVTKRLIKQSPTGKYLKRYISKVKRAKQAITKQI
ncbi:hypothetical protein MML48_9g00016404 [Holotrichia oblita]|uniref:Uncharacterized protein n=1 Tax=Holotrichia oblita TaxID=644536 RepID=A0ACB9SJT1_HOLOL|nr:hypothetical protein MML48_9g00016404 [Holotrichia oblita]